MSRNRVVDASVFVSFFLSLRDPLFCFQTHLANRYLAYVPGGHPMAFVYILAERPSGLNSLPASFILSLYML